MRSAWTGSARRFGHGSLRNTQGARASSSRAGAGCEASPGTQHGAAGRGGFSGGRGATKKLQTVIATRTKATPAPSPPALRHTFVLTHQWLAACRNQTSPVSIPRGVPLLRGTEGRGERTGPWGITASSCLRQSRPSTRALTPASWWWQLPRGFLYAPKPRWMNLLENASVPLRPKATNRPLVPTGRHQRHPLSLMRPQEE